MDYRTKIEQAEKDYAIAIIKACKENIESNIDERLERFKSLNKDQQMQVFSCSDAKILGNMFDLALDKESPEATADVLESSAAEDSFPKYPFERKVNIEEKIELAKDIENKFLQMLKSIHPTN